MSNIVQLPLRRASGKVAIGPATLLHFPAWVTLKRIPSPPEIKLTPDEEVMAEMVCERNLRHGVTDTLEHARQRVFEAMTELRATLSARAEA
ncbi:hypothetical protein [Xanthomonas campestris]|uniref:hypothetical protein n=1 Tax=Xanthomonas campestris TaxID=339 RepID=UPI000E1ED47B|nr:hypothetical protein [Xanthomonas campestris]